MLRYVTGHDDEIARIAAKMIPYCQRGFGKCKAIGVIDDDGELIAGIVYHNWSPEAQVVEMSIAALPGKRWMTRETLRVMFAFPFEQMKCQMILHCVPAEDERILRQLAAGGYMLLRVPRLLGRESDAVLGLLTREQWEASKFIKHKPAVVEEAA